MRKRYIDVTIVVVLWLAYFATISISKTRLALEQFDDTYNAVPMLRYLPVAWLLFNCYATYILFRRKE